MPVGAAEPEAFVEGRFRSCEGISFNGEGRLFATCDRRLVEIGADASVRVVTELDSNVGVAAYGERDLLVAAFGPTNAFRQHRNDDGVVWRITPEGNRSVAASGIGDPNAIVVLPDRSFLVSDDATNAIFRIAAPGERALLFTTAVNHPNGLVLTADGRTLFAAQTFSTIRPILFDARLWSIPLGDGAPSGPATLAARHADGAANDGLAIDDRDRVYVAANKAGEVWRYDPADGSVDVVARDLFGAASLAFGQGEFDRESVYVTTAYADGRGGKIWRVGVGARAGPIYR